MKKSEVIKTHTTAHQVAMKVGLVKSTGWTQYQLSRSELIEAIQVSAVNCSNFDDELFVFTDDSCIRRVFDNYFLHDDVDTLSKDFLDSLSYV